ncbi:MAG: alpha/beta hydrolase family protein [Gammaproteobacteria bacterium]|nr:alpha/beta hydrolase family protein [Gammaproteobacteria bacterium]
MKIPTVIDRVFKVMRFTADTVLLALLAGLALYAANAAATQPDYAREQRLATEIEDAILDGEPLWLEAEQRRFFAIHTQSQSATPRGAVIILHGRGFHPDWADAVNPLRVGLPEYGWETLSLQMPVLAKDAKYYDYVAIFPFALPRIDAGIAYLRDRGVQKIVLLAHSCGVHMSMAWLKARGDHQIDAYVGLGMGATDYRQPMREPFPLAQLRVPVLEAYGDGDYPAVLRMAPQRLQAMRQAGHPKSQQQVIADADHYFTDRGAALLATVAGWLDGL